MRSFLQSIYQAASPHLILNHKRVTAPPAVEQNDESTSSSSSSSPSAPPTLPKIPVDHAAMLRSIFSQFNTPLEDAIKMKDPKALDQFDLLLTQCAELYNSPTLPEHLSIPASQLLKKMNMLKVAVASSKTPLRTSVQLQSELQEASARVERQREEDVQSKIRARQVGMQQVKDAKAAKKSKKLTVSGRKRRRQSDDASEASSDSEADSFDELDLVDSSESETEATQTKRSVKSHLSSTSTSQSAPKSPVKLVIKPQLITPITPRTSRSKPAPVNVAATPTSIRTTRTSNRITPTSSVTVIPATPVTRRSAKRLTLPASPETIKSNLSKLRNRVHVDETKLAQSASKNKRVKRVITTQPASVSVFDFEGDM